MEVSGRVVKYVAFGLVALLLVGVVFVALKRASYERQLTELRNALASKDETIEVQKNVYHKLTLQLKDLSAMLENKDHEVAALKVELRKKREELLTATTLVAKWKAAYEAEVKGRQTEVPPVNPGDPARTKVEFEKDFGYIGIKGYTLTNPGFAWVRVQQNRPLKITLALSQDSKKQWHTYATSSEDNVAVDISVTGVNPWLLQPKWYENIGVTTAVGGGSGPGGAGALVGFGLNYKIKQFDVGPAMWLTITDRVDKFYGVNFTWRPFQRN